MRTPPHTGMKEEATEDTTNQEGTKNSEREGIAHPQENGMIEDNL